MPSTHARPLVVCVCGAKHIFSSCATYLPYFACNVLACHPVNPQVDSQSGQASYFSVEGVLLPGIHSRPPSQMKGLCAKVLPFLLSLTSIGFSTANLVCNGYVSPSTGESVATPLWGSVAASKATPQTNATNPFFMCFTALATYTYPNNVTKGGIAPAEAACSWFSVLRVRLAITPAAACCTAAWL